MGKYEESIWLVGKGVIDGATGKETLFGVTIQNIPIAISFNPEFKQIYMTLNREELMLFRDAINKEIGEKP